MRRWQISPMKLQEFAQLRGSGSEGRQESAYHRQVIDATNGDHLWAWRFDRDLTDIFAIQDEITQSVTTALQVEFTEGEYARKWRASTDDVEAWDLYLRANAATRRFTKEDSAEAKAARTGSHRIGPGVRWRVGIDRLDLLGGCGIWMG